MNLLGQPIIEEGITYQTNIKLRETVRAILLNDNNEVGLLYSTLFNDYTFPGGGIKDGEAHKTALERELKEELGANQVEILNAFGYTEEIKYGLHDTKDVYVQKSYYYLCRINQIETPQYVGREIYQGLSFAYKNIEEAILKNQVAIHDANHQKEGLKTTLHREILVLNKIKEIINEKI